MTASPGQQPVRWQNLTEMIDGLIEPGTEEGWRVIDSALRSARSRLGDDLLSAYAIGSLAHGGFRLAVSDVDLALLTDDRPAQDMIKIVAAITADVCEGAHQLGDRLSVFHAPWTVFGDPPPDARFAPIDRYDLVRYGILVHGVDLRAAHATAPTADAVREHAVDSALRRVTAALLAEDLDQFAADGITVHDATKLCSGLSGCSTFATPAKPPATRTPWTTTYNSPTHAINPSRRTPSVGAT